MIYNICMNTTNKNVDRVNFGYGRPLDTNKKRVLDVVDEPWEHELIFLPKLFIGHNKSTHGHNIRGMDDVTSPWTKNHV